MECLYLYKVIQEETSVFCGVIPSVLVRGKKVHVALHFVMRIVKNGNKNTKSLACTSLVRPILEYGAAYWDPYREYQLSPLDRVQNKAAKFAHHWEGSDWESLAQGRKIARVCPLYKAYTGQKAWKAIGDR